MTVQSIVLKTGSYVDPRSEIEHMESETVFYSQG